MTTSFAIAAEFTTMHGVLPMRRYTRSPCLSANARSVLYGKGPRLNKLPTMGHVNGPGGRFFRCQRNFATSRIAVNARITVKTTLSLGTNWRSRSVAMEKCILLMGPSRVPSSRNSGSVCPLITPKSFGFVSRGLDLCLYVRWWRREFGSCLPKFSTPGYSTLQQLAAEATMLRSSASVAAAFGRELEGGSPC